MNRITIGRCVPMTGAASRMAGCVAERRARPTRALPGDYLGCPATVRADGRVLYDGTLYRVKPASKTMAPWDPSGPHPSARRPGRVSAHRLRLHVKECA
jgi:hypothetical protein